MQTSTFFFFFCCLLFFPGGKQGSRGDGLKTNIESVFFCISNAFAKTNTNIWVGQCHLDAPVELHGGGVTTW